METWAGCAEKPAVAQLSWGRPEGGVGWGVLRATADARAGGGGGWGWPQAEHVGTGLSALGCEPWNSHLGFWTLIHSNVYKTGVGRERGLGVH